jgi:hypothetical protein
MIQKKSDRIKDFQTYIEQDNKNIILSNYSANELKTFNYLIYALQKEFAYDKSANMQKVSKDLVWSDKHNSHILYDWRKHDSMDDPAIPTSMYLTIDYKELSRFLKIDKQNYMVELENILKSLGSKRVKYKYPNGKGYSYIAFFYKINFNKKDANIRNSRYDISVQLSLDIVAECLKFSEQFVKINISTIQNIRSKYSIRIYEELERVYTETNKNGNFIKSQENLNKFFGTEYNQQELYKILLRVKKELEKLNIFTFECVKYKNKSGDWIYSITDIRKCI